MGLCSTLILVRISYPNQSSQRKTSTEAIAIKDFNQVHKVVGTISHRCFKEVLGGSWRKCYWPTLILVRISYAIHSSQHKMSTKSIEIKKTSIRCIR